MRFEYVCPLRISKAKLIEEYCLDFICLSLIIGLLISQVVRVDIQK